MEEIVINPECCICYEHVSQENSVSMTCCCKNTIHKVCFIQWLVIKIENISCPICGTHLDKQNLNSILPKKTFIEYSKNIIKDKSKYLAAVIYDLTLPLPVRRSNLDLFVIIYKYILIFIVALLVVVVLLSWILHKN